MEVDGSAKAIAAAEAAGGVFDPLDLRVEALGHGVGDGPAAPVEQGAQTALERLRQPLDRLEAAAAKAPTLEGIFSAVSEFCAGNPLSDEAVEAQQ